MQKFIVLSTDAVLDHTLSSWSSDPLLRCHHSPVHHRGGCDDRSHPSFDTMIDDDNALLHSSHSGWLIHLTPAQWAGTQFILVRVRYQNGRTILLCCCPPAPLAGLASFFWVGEVLRPHAHIHDQVHFRYKYCMLRHLLSHSPTPYHAWTAFSPPPLVNLSCCAFTTYSSSLSIIFDFVSVRDETLKITVSLLLSCIS